MAKTLQFRRGTTSELSTVTGAVGELFVDTTKDVVVVMDGSTAGGFPLQRELTAGSGIDITGNTISATGGSYGNAEVAAWLATSNVTQIGQNDPYSSHITFTSDLELVASSTAKVNATMGSIELNSGFGNVYVVQGNITTPGILTDNYYYADGTPVSFGGGSDYSNVNVTAYLSTFGTSTQSTIGGSNFGNPRIVFNTNGSMVLDASGDELTLLASNAVILSSILGNVYVPTGNITTPGILTDNYYYADGTPVSFGSGSYTLPIASDTILGGIKIGSGLSIDGNGVVTATGGAASTGDFTFSANTISLPEFTDGTLNVTGNVGVVSVVTLDTLTFDVDYGFTQQYNIFAVFTESPKRLVIEKNGDSDITFDDTFALELASKMTTGSLLSIVGGGGQPNQSLIPVTAGLAFSATGWNGQPAWTAEIPTLGATYAGSSLASFSVQEYQDDRVATDFTYTFSQTGEFISDSAVIGDVLISDDIITPLALDSYGQVDSTATGTLTINGDLEVLGDTTGVDIVSFDQGTPTDASRSDNLALGRILQKGKKYYFTSSGTAILPAVSTLSRGDTVEVVFLNETPGAGLSIQTYEENTTTMYSHSELSANVVIDNGTFPWAQARLSGYGIKVTFIYHWINSPSSPRWMVTQ